MGLFMGLVMGLGRGCTAVICGCDTAKRFARPHHIAFTRRANGVPDRRPGRPFDGPLNGAFNRLATVEDGLDRGCVVLGNKVHARENLRGNICLRFAARVVAGHHDQIRPLGRHPTHRRALALIPVTAASHHEHDGSCVLRAHRFEQFLQAIRGVRVIHDHFRQFERCLASQRTMRLQFLIYPQRGRRLAGESVLRRPLSDRLRGGRHNAASRVSNGHGFKSTRYRRRTRERLGCLGGCEASRP